MKLLIAVVVFAAAQCCFCETTDESPEVIIQECMSQENIPAESLKGLWEGEFDNGASNEIMLFTKCLLKEFGIAKDGVLMEDYVDNCSQHEDREICESLYNSCNLEQEGDDLESSFKIFVCLRQQGM